MRSQGTGDAPSDRSDGARGAVDKGWSTALRAGVLGSAVLGAALLIASEFMTLYRVGTTTADHPIGAVTTGSNDTYALIPIAVVAVVLAFGAVVRGSRPALLALGALGVATLLLALIGDWPTAHATGMVGNAAAGFQKGSAKPQAGLYIETLGAIVLIISSGCGILLAAPGGARQGRPRAPAAGAGSPPA